MFKLNHTPGFSFQKLPNCEVFWENNGGFSMIFKYLYLDVKKREIRENFFSRETKKLKEKLKGKKENLFIALNNEKQRDKRIEFTSLNIFL